MYRCTHVREIVFTVHTWFHHSNENFSIRSELWLRLHVKSKTAHELDCELHSIHKRRHTHSMRPKSIQHTTAPARNTNLLAGWICSESSTCWAFSSNFSFAIKWSGEPNMRWRWMEWDTVVDDRHFYRDGIYIMIMMKLWSGMCKWFQLSCGHTTILEARESRVGAKRKKMSEEFSV